ncbi:MAG: phosphotransferase [Lacisediminihabitans sp.]
MVAISFSAKPAHAETAPKRDELREVLAEPDTLEQLAKWISTQRWYGGKGRELRPKILGGFSLTHPSAEVNVRVVFVLDEAESPKLYQVPLTAHRSPVASLAGSLVATGVTSGGESLYLYDGPQDPVFAMALMDLMLSEGTAPVDSTPPEGRTARENDAEYPVLARGHAAFPNSGSEVITSRVLGGEQSNTSIVYEMKDADGAPASPIICKLFRTLHHGDNPDVVLLDALGAVNCLVVPRSIGHVTGEWSDTGEPGGTARGHLAFAQEFLPGVEDAWRVTLQAAEDGKDFTVAARALGEATAEVHKSLARALGTTPCSAAGISDSMESMRRRLGLAIGEVPELAEWKLAIETVYTRAAAAAWPKLQRIHGDLHLGQVLAVPGRGWVLLDFEGEPLRPMSERSRPDSPLRDVAGMLRSFDYVAGAFALAHPGHNATDWALACRRAYVSGYSARTGHNLREDRVLLDAFEIDKAIYEAIYEARNRPDWLPIPVAAIKRLAERASAP